MPRIKDLERFQRDLTALARENEVLAQWGETREELSLPSEEGLPSQAPQARKSGSPLPSDRPPDFSDLLGGSPSSGRGASKEELEALLTLPEEGSAPETPAPGPEEEAGFEDFLATLESMPEPEAGPVEAPSVDEGFDLGALESGAAESFAEPELEPEAPTFDLSSIAESMEETAGFGEPEPTIPEFGETAIAGEELPSAEDLLPSEGEVFPQEGGAEEAAPPLEDFSMPGLEDLDFTAEVGAEAAGGAEAEAMPAPGEPPADESFDLGLGELGDLGLGGAEGGAPAKEGLELGPEEAPGTPSGPAAAPDLGGFDFSMPAEGQDAFDSFSFGEPGGGQLAGEALDRELAKLGTDSGQATTFNLDGAWTEFGAPEEEPERRIDARARKPEAGPAAPARTLALSEAQVDRLQDSLLALPLNLRVAIEDSIANEKGTEAQRVDLVWLLVEGAGAAELASAAGKILRKRIAIPEGYVHRTGAGYLAEKGSFGYLFANTILPILRTAAVVLLLAGAVSYLGYRFVWQPIHATLVYREGYQRIGQGRYTEAEEAFGRATEIREFVSWYYRYAEAYVERKQWLYAERKYEALLKRHPAEKKGALAWARLERDQLKYREAIDILDTYVIDRLPRDRDALLLEGDIFLEWADEEPARYEDARKRYAMLIQFYGAQNLYLERMLLYFMRVDKPEEVAPLKNRFLRMPNTPLEASTLAELGGYLLDHDGLPEVRKVLDLALKKDRGLPETHYQLFRFFRESGNKDEELKALGNTIAGFEALPALGKRRLSMYLEALLRRGDVELLAKQYIKADEDYGKAAVAYESALEIGRLSRTPAWARAYAGLADVAYWGKDDLEAARVLYERAEKGGWDSPDIRYRRGFIAYRQERFADALEEFWRSWEGGLESPWLTWALANSFSSRGDWHAAEGYFRKLVDSLGDKLSAKDYPLPQEKLSDRTLVAVLMEAQNNLGVALFKLGNRLGNSRLKAEAIPAFSESARLYDLLVHDARSLIGANQANLGYANLDYVLHPRRGIDLSSYAAISKDTTWPVE